MTVIGTLTNLRIVRRIIPADARELAQASVKLSNLSELYRQIVPGFRLHVYLTGSKAPGRYGSPPGAVTLLKAPDAASIWSRSCSL